MPQLHCGQLEKFLAWLHHGPSAAQVTQVESEWQPETGVRLLTEALQKAGLGVCGGLSGRGAGIYKRAIYGIMIVLLLATSASAQEVGKRAATPYAEKGYFTVEMPAGWEKADSAFGLSQGEKKVYGADFFAAADQDGLAPRISVHYYAPGNLLHKTADKFIKMHSESVFGAGTVDDGRSYGPVIEGLVGKHSAKTFERNTFEYIPPSSINQKKIPVYEKFAVIPSKAGFYVLRLYSPGGISKANLKAYESVLASFKGIVAQTSSSL